MTYTVKGFNVFGVCTYSKDWLVLDYAVEDHMMLEDNGYLWVLCDNTGTILNTNWMKYEEAVNIWEIPELTENYEYWSKEDENGFTQAELDMVYLGLLYVDLD